MARFRLRHGTQEIELPAGDFAIGRGAECQLTLDDPLVSRRHAILHVSDTEVVLEDLGSRNGVLVNGTTVRDPTRLLPADTITIGTHELVLTISVASRRPTVTALTLSPEFEQEDRTSTPGLLAGPPPHERPAGDARPSSGGLLLGIAAKALQLGRVDEAERIFGNLTGDWKRQARGRSAISLDDLAGFAVLLANATSKTRWVDWLFDAYRTEQRVLPATLIDELHAFVRRSRYPATSALRGYVEQMRTLEGALDPASRFLLKRIEGLLEVASSN